MNPEAPEVTLFREYLRIKTVHPNPDFEGAVKFLKRQADEIGLEFSSYECVKGKPIVILTWPGTDLSLPSLILNSHVDVVPVEENRWKYDPFGAHKDEEGNIYGRGTQDMKSVGIQHIICVGKLKKQGFKPLRTIHLMFVPDEEVGGHQGMELFVETERFAQLNAGVVLDEGLASSEDDFTVFYGERSAWWVKMKATGPTGHGSRFIENPAMERLIRVVNKLLAFRKQQFEELQRGIAECGMKLGDVTTLNLTMIKGGVTSDGKNFQLNVVPSEAEAGFDIRIPPSVNLDEFKKQLDDWTSSEGVTYEFVQHNMVNKASDISPDSKWWKLIKNTLQETGCKLDPQIFPAATDSRFIRNKNIPAFGFSPMNHTPTLLHDHNEFLNEKIFLKGVDIFCTLVSALASAQ